MKKLLLGLFTITLLFNFVPISVKADSEEFSVEEYYFNIHEYTNENVYPIVSGIQYATISTATPTWNALKHEDLIEGGFMFPSGNYVFYNYDINFENGEIVQGIKNILTYQELVDLENTKGSKIDSVATYYAKASEITANYYLVNTDGSKELLKTDITYGRYEVSPDEFHIPSDTLTFDPITASYLFADETSKETKLFTANDQVIDINLRLPSITISYEDADGIELKNSSVFSDKVGQIFNYTVPTLEGYTLKSEVWTGYNVIDKSVS